MGTDAKEPKRGHDPRSKLRVVVNCPVWMLGTKLDWVLGKSWMCSEALSQVSMPNLTFFDIKTYDTIKFGSKNYLIM